MHSARHHRRRRRRRRLDGSVTARRRRPMSTYGATDARAFAGRFTGRGGGVRIGGGGGERENATDGLLARRAVHAHSPRVVSL